MPIRNKLKNQPQNLLGTLALSGLALFSAGSLMMLPIAPHAMAQGTTDLTQTENILPAPIPVPTGSIPKLSIKVKLIQNTVKQGDTLSITVESPNSSGLGDIQALHAKLADKTVPLYPEHPTRYVGWIPVSVFQKPGGYTLSISDKTGRALASEAVTVLNAKLPVQNISVSKSVGGLQAEPGELETVAALKTRLTWQRFWTGAFISPTTDCQNSPFGVLRYHNGKPTGDYHKGVDLRSPLGRPVIAINGGKVVIAKKFRLHGGTVGIDHGFGFSSIYIHMSQINVKPGQQVGKGETIGKVGATGFATGPHLHWGLFINGLPVNPNQWVTGVPRC